MKKRNESISQLQATIGSSYISDLERETKVDLLMYFIELVGIFDDTAEKD